MLEDSMTSHEIALYHTLLVPVMYVRPELKKRKEESWPDLQRRFNFRP